MGRPALALALLAGAAAAVGEGEEEGDFPTVARAEYEALRRRDVWDFQHVPAQRAAGPGWLQHRFGKSPDGAGGTVSLDYEHKLQGGGRHLLHNVDEHDDLTHVGCAGTAVRLRYASGASPWSRALKDAGQGGGFRRDTLLVPQPWGCAVSRLPEGGFSTFFTVLSRSCLEQDGHGCVHHHLEVEPAHLLEVFEALDLDFHWVPPPEAAPGAAPSLRTQGARRLEEEQADRRLLQRYAPRRLTRTENEEFAQDRPLDLEPNLDEPGNVRRACRGGRIPGSEKWWGCPRATFPHGGSCYCPAGSWYNKDRCDDQGCEIVFNTCEEDGVPIPGSWGWYRQCGAYGSVSCYDNKFCCCPRGMIYLEVVNRCCNCTDASSCELPEAWEGGFNVSLTNVGPSLATFSKPTGGWGINFDSMQSPPVVHHALDVGKDMSCINCFAGIRQVEFHWRINLFRMLLLEFVLNVSFPVEFNIALRLKAANSTTSPETKEPILKWPFPGLLLAGVLNIAPFMSLDVALQYIVKLRACHVDLPDFFMRSSKPAVWTYGVEYHKHSLSGPRTYKVGPSTDNVEHNLWNFTKGSVAELLAALGRDFDTVANMTWKIEPMVIVGLDVAGLTDVGVALQLPFPVSLDTALDVPAPVGDSLQRIGAAGWRFAHGGGLPQGNSTAKANATAAEERRLARKSITVNDVSMIHENFVASDGAGALEQPGTPAERFAEHFWQKSFLTQLGSRREGFMESVNFEDFYEICYGFVVEDGAYSNESVKLEARMANGYVRNSALRPKGARGELSLCGCTPPVALNELLFTGNFTFTVLHDPITDELAGAATMPDEKNYSGISDGNVSAGLEIFATLLNLVGRRVLEEKSILLYPRILWHDRITETMDNALVWLEWSVVEQGPDRSLLDFDLEAEAFDGESASRAPSGEMPAQPSLTIIAQRLHAAQRWEQKRQSNSDCEERSKAAARRRLEEDTYKFQGTDDVKSNHEEESPLGPLTMGCTIKRKVQMALVWSGIRINRRWLENAMEVATNIMLTIASGGTFTWVGPWFQKLWDKASPMIRKSMPVSKRWRWQVVPYMYEDTALTDEGMFHFDVCEVLAEYAPWFPCWMLVPVVAAIAAASWLCQIRYCSCLTPLFGCWPFNLCCKLPRRSSRKAALTTPEAGGAVSPETTPLE